jgi:hypothetical protein
VQPLQAVFSKEIREKYTIMQLLWDIGMIDEFAVKIRDYYKSPAL